MNPRSIFYLIILIFPVLCSSQSFEWEGYGKGLSYLKIKDGKITFNSCRWSDTEWATFIGIKDQWILCRNTDGSNGREYDFRIEVFNSSFDSMRIWYMDIPITYYRPELLYFVQDPRSQYHFQDIRIELLNNWGGKNYVIEFNIYGKLRYADYENTTLFEEKLDPSIVDQFKELIKYIDINNINQCGGQTNQCDNDEITFLFRDGYYEEYGFRSMHVPLQLDPVLKFFKEILKSKGHPVEWPRRY